MTRKRALSMALCALLCVAMVLSITYIALAAMHECPGACCLVCVEIQSRYASMKWTSCVLAVFAAVFHRALRVIALTRRSAYIALSMTPVSLKVKLNN